MPHYFIPQCSNDDRVMFVQEMQHEISGSDNGSCQLIIHFSSHRELLQQQ